MLRVFVLALLGCAFSLSKPLSEVIKDIEISGGARYCFKSNSYKKERNKKILQDTVKKESCN